MKILNSFFIALFIFSAALQYNDPDPYIWMPIYLYGALLCFLDIRKKYNLLMHYIGIAVYATYATCLFFDSNGVLAWINHHAAESIVQTMKATKPWIEETREFMGLLILISALLINIIVNKKVKRY